MFIKSICIVVIFAFSFLGNAHEYYFAFAEMQFNKEKSRFEISIRATGHDVEEYMEKIGHTIPKLEDCINKPAEMQKLEKLITTHFIIEKEGNSIILELVGMEVNTKDEVIFYLVSRKMEQPEKVDITFDLLMNYFEDQQNKLTVFTEKGKVYLSFLPHQTKRILAYN